MAIDCGNDTMLLFDKSKYERLDKEKQVVIKKSYPQKISEADIN